MKGLKVVIELLRKIDRYLHKIFSASNQVHTQNMYVESLSLVDEAIISKYLNSKVMGTPLALANLLTAVEYVESSKIPGDFVECGVWRGGSALAATEKLISLNSFDRNIWLYDTFSGMSEPTSFDVRIHDDVAASALNWEANSDNLINGVGYEGGVAAAASLRDVQSSFEQLQYPGPQIKYVIGKVEETLLDSSNLPREIAILRLDTDWYESTLIELKELWPKLARGGILILDDYDYWEGCRIAVDEFFSSIEDSPALIRMDHGRIAIKS